MKTTPSLREFQVLALSLVSIWGTAWCSQKRDVVQEAHGIYYNLKAIGLNEFSCQVAVDFDATYRDVKMDAVGREQVLPAAKKILFHVAVGPTGAASISHQFEGAPPSEDIAERLQQIAGGIEQILSGFFETWSGFMVNSFFEGTENDYHIEALDSGYRLTSDDAKTHVVLSLDHDLIMTAVAVKTPDSEAELHPKFAPHEGGVVLQSYESVFKPESGNPQQMEVRIAYQDVGRFALPKTVEVRMAVPKGRIDAPISFNNCQAKRK